MSSDSKELFDLLILSHNRNQIVADGSMGALIRFMAVTRLIVPAEESLAQGWSEVYCSDGGASHELYMEGERPEGYQGFLETTFRFGSEKATLPFGPHKEAPFFILIQGATHDDIAGVVRAKMQELLYIQPDVHIRPHGELRPHQEVPEGMERIDKKRLRRNLPNQSAGTRVEEY